MADENDWKEQLPEELRADPSLQNFDSIDKLAKSYVEMKSFQGNSIRIPGEDAGEEDRQKFIDKLLQHAPNLMLKPESLDNPEESREFWRTLGAPEKPEEYEFPELSDQPEGFEVPRETVDRLRQYAHEIGMTKGQFKKFVEKMTTDEAKRFTESVSQLQEKWNGLIKEWGLATDERLKKAADVATKLGAPDQLIESMKNKTLDPDLVKFMYSVAEAVGKPEGVNSTDTPTGPTGLTPAEAQAKIDEIYANKDHPFHRGDAAALKRMLELVAAANPQASTDVNDLRAKVIEFGS